MGKFIRKVVYFLHISDGHGQLDLEDMAFILIVGKVLFAPGIDYSALGALIAVIMSKMHSNSIK